jgi:predicted esterase
MKRAVWWRRVAMLVMGFIVVVAFVFALGEAYKTRDFQPHFLDRKGALISVSEVQIEKRADFEMLHIVLGDDRGLEVEGHLKVPTRCDGPYRTLVILGGIRTGRRTIEYLGDTGDWLVVALDYPYGGKRSGLSYGEFLVAFPQMRRAVLDTVPAGMLAVDYLLQRGDADDERILLAGGSFGAMFAPAMAAADDRISAVAIFFGAGDLDVLIDTNLDLWWPLKPIVSWIGSVVVSPLEPLKYVGRISPRPVFMLNGTEDPAMPEFCCVALHDAAGQPKTIRWLPLGHVDIRSSEFHRQVLEEFLAWLRQIGFLSEVEAFDLVPQE